MKRAVIFAFLALCSSVNAQLLPIYYDTTSNNSEIILSTNGGYASSAILKEFSSLFYKGGIINSDMTDRSLNRHKVVNRIGFDASGELTYRSNSQLIDKWNLGYQITAGTYYFGGALYAKDLFQLVFKGNSSFKGDTAIFSGSDLNYTAFQKIGFGLVSNKNRSYLNFNIYNIQDRIDLNVRKGELSVSSDADTIGLSGDFTLSMKNDASFNQGIGFGLDFCYYMPIEWKQDKTAFVEFQIQNLGFGYMYKDQKYYDADTSFTFSGFRFNELFGDQAINFDSLNVLDTLGIKQSYKNYTFLLPGFIQVAKIVDENSDAKIQPFFGLRLYPTLNYNPMAFAGIDYKPTKNLHVGVNASYGGFAKFRGGIYASGNFGKVRIGLGTENIIGAFSGKGNGISANFRLSCVF